MASRLGGAVLLLAAATMLQAGPIRSNARPIPGSYIVVLRPDAVRDARDGLSRLPSVADVATELLDIAGHGRRGHVFQHALAGFGVQATAAEAARLADDYRVAFVEEDGVVEAVATQPGAPWGLDRVDQRSRPLSGSYSYDRSGDGVHAYVIDTGLRASHAEFAGRVGNGFTAIGDGQGLNDCNGHGTHVAGTIGGTTWGVAKAVRLHPVRVLGCDGAGSTADVIAGVDWVTGNHARPAVANMSLGGGVSSALDAAVTGSIAAGVVYAVAAGNSNTNACAGSPARVAAALTTGASNSSDERAPSSNFGACLDIFAPGSDIPSAWSTSNSATATLSGTSTASPHVAGAAALYLQAHPDATPAELAQALVEQSTPGVVTGAGSGSPNRLLYSPADVPSAAPRHVSLQ